ncbi:MAG: AAC(3)-IV family aminoglycoside N-acetyltransferase [Methanobacterium sp.]
MKKRKKELSKVEVTNQLLSLGVEKGGVLVVHTSFKAIRPVEGGPEGLIMAILDSVGSEGTLVMPSWTGNDNEVFDPMITNASPDLGVVADIFWRLPGVIRSNHCFAFAAIGPKAAQIISDPLPIPPHIPKSPIGRVYELDGQVLLLGVNHDADTMIHLAELLANVPYRVPRYCTVIQEGIPIQIEYGENDHCCMRFAFLDGWLRDRGLQSEGYVGHAYTKLARARDIVNVALEHLTHDPLIFLHPSSEECIECNNARKSI